MKLNSSREVKALEKFSERLAGAGASAQRVGGQVMRVGCAIMVLGMAGLLLFSLF